jgi:hypothetical protein
VKTQGIRVIGAARPFIAQLAFRMAAFRNLCSFAIAQRRFMALSLPDRSEPNEIA